MEKNKLRVFFITLFFSLITDQISKKLIVPLIILKGGDIKITPFLSLSYVRNYGIFFGFLNRQEIRIFIIIFSFLAVFLIYFYILRNKIQNTFHLISLGLIEGGILGNLIDRIKYGYVIDFINFHYWPVFNLADSFIVTGVIIFFIKSLKE